MNTQDIIYRPKDWEIHELEMNYVIEQYIYEKKKVNVKLSDSRVFLNPFLYVSRELSKKLYCFEIARQYFLNK